MLVGCVFSLASWFMVQGALASAATFCLMTWVIPKRGPTYPPILLGSVVIIVGLYAFLWAKSKEYQKSNQPLKNIEGDQAKATAPVDECSTMVK
ncbi:hypothetical protein JRO89_XS15G0002400 [Xanthoceras sorbifolium]|uniref:WAT1-related protein n=1 Tax=Xanthoceras sorbifolium TaxID=99658 RepID=A0ABQ8H0G9_9ROSI|nr:hypothetical protein JRO89_XS15G0002400 [Xanthoceras sorbifolium]